MNELITIFQAPLVAGIIYPQIFLEVFLLVFKLFDVWSTNYIVGKKDGTEIGPMIAGMRVTLALQFMKLTGSVKGGLALDFAVVALAGWLLYVLPWPYLAGVVTWYAYWMITLQVTEVRKSQLKS